ncbi:DegV family EDD domain-containing protein [Christensenellaceae bacterium OttesenSCG-928-L17]|nr:DegV family EDD domain-containing protein [Christensenellaceae bacterium OttesenSCG-928-L17]
MGQSYAICMDTGADIPWRTVQLHQLLVAHLHYTIHDVSHTYDLGREADLASLYFSMRNGTAIATAPVRVEEFCALWEPMLALGRDILYLAVSAQLSETFQNAQQARKEMLTRYPVRRIVLVDTQACSIAQGMLLYEAAQMQKEGQTLDHVADWVVQNRAYVHFLLLPVSLRGLREAGFVRGGAIKELLSRRMAVRLNEKGHIERDGGFSNTGDALDAMVDYAAHHGYALGTQTVSVVHTDEAELAADLRQKLFKETGCADVAVLPMNPFAGCHVLPGAVGLAFFGSRR